MRLVSFDNLKGILILFVILAHVLLGTMEENPARQFIFLFATPAFLAIAGYFTKKRFLTENSFGTIIKKYWKRVIIPYIVALVFFTVVTNRDILLSGNLTAMDVLDSILFPYYHLWFISTLIMAIIFTTIILKLRIPILPLLIFLILFTLLWKMFVIDLWKEYTFIHYLGHSRLYSLYFYFLFGFYLANSDIRLNTKPMIISLPILAVVYLYAFIHAYPLLHFPIGIIFNLILIYVMIRECQRITSLKPSVMTRIGLNSLPIYLWHIAPLLVTQKLFMASNLGLYYFSTTIVMIAFVWIILILPKNKFLDTFIYGR